MAGVCFINGQSDRQWIESLREAAQSLGKPFMRIDHWRLQDKLQDCELIIIDAGAIGDDLISVVERIRALNSGVRIVVVSSVPHWKEARQILLAGATDYVRKENDREAILGILRGNLPALQHRFNVTGQETKGNTHETHHLTR